MISFLIYSAGRYLFRELYLPWHSLHHSLLPVQKWNNVVLYGLPDLCPLNSPDLDTFISKYWAATSESTRTRRWQVTISCQPDGRPPQPVRHQKSRVRVCEFTYFQANSAFSAAILRIKTYCSLLLFKNNKPTPRSQGFVGQSSSKLAQV